VRSRSLAALGLAVCAAAGLAGCGGGEKPRPDLIFVSSKSGVYDIYAMNADGSRQTRLTRGKTGDATNGLFYAADPTWSRDGRRIAFWSTRLGQPRIFVMDASGQNARALTSAPAPSAQPSWSPDGTRIAFVSGSTSQLEVMNADGKGAHRLTSSPLQVVKESSPAWSPDGRWIAYVETETGRPIKEIWLVHPDGTANHQLTNLQASTGNPAWSPDSKQLVFSSDFKGGHYGIYTDVIKGGRSRIVSLTTIDEVDPSWSPDGKRIAYSRDGSIVTVDPDGSNEKVVTSPKDNDSSPVWNPIVAPAKAS
jgi:Tol biopolymer transport system component